MRKNPNLCGFLDQKLNNIAGKMKKLGVSRKVKNLDETADGCFTFKKPRQKCTY